MNDFLAKPIDPTVLLEAAARWIRVCEAGSGDTESIESFDAELASVAKDWLAVVPTRLATANAALDMGGLAAAAAVAHALKGSGGTLGFPEFTRPSIRLEAACTSGDLDAARAEIERVRMLHRDLTARLAAREAA